MGLDLPERAERGGRPLRRTAAVIAGLVSMPLLAGCSEAQVDQWSRLGLLEPANSSAPHMLELWIGAWIAAGVIGVVVWGLIIWAVVRYRRRSRDEVPVQVRYNLPIEALYTITPFVVIFVLFYHTVVAQEAILPDEPEVDHEVLVVGQQWSWTFNHLGADGLDGEGSDGPAGNDVFTVGTTAEPPTLVLPVGETVRFRFYSPDVIHSFWIPAYYFKMDVIPGRENTWTTTPTETGTFDGRCAELCGVSHARMLFNVEVVEPAEYDAYLAELAAQGNYDTATGSTDADTIAGLESEVPPGERNVQ